MIDRSIIPSMTPRKAWKAWRRYFADTGGLDHIFTTNRHTPVELALGEYELNYGKAAEETSRKNLAARLTDFNPNYALPAD